MSDEANEIICIGRVVFTWIVEGEQCDGEPLYVMVCKDDLVDLFKIAEGIIDPMWYGETEWRGGTSNCLVYSDFFFNACPPSPTSRIIRRSIALPYSGEADYDAKAIGWRFI